MPLSPVNVVVENKKKKKKIRFVASVSPFVCMQSAPKLGVSSAKLAPSNAATHSRKQSLIVEQ
jgi:hypothetical protein